MCPRYVLIFYNADGAFLIETVFVCDERLNILRVVVVVVLGRFRKTRGIQF